MADEIPDSPETPAHAPDGWEMACLGIMRSSFGRYRSKALSKAMMQLSAERAWQEARVEATRSNWWQRIRGTFALNAGPRMVVGIAAVVMLVGLVWWLWPTNPGENQNVAVMPGGCRIADALNARWKGNSTPLKTGDAVPDGEFHLESGVVELSFVSGAKAAIEGPADLKITRRNGMELRSGKMSAEVPPPARGFTVRTPNGTIVDLGTRFGINAKGAEASEVDVFEGKVQVTQGADTKQPDNQWDLTRNMAMVLDRRGGATAAAAPETAFPQPGHVILIRPANCGFDSPGSVRIGGLPSAFGYWSGPAFDLTGPVADVRPVQGSGMLRFRLPPRQGGNAVDSVVWQVIDLTAAKGFMTTYGVTDLKAWVQFNRLPGDSRTATRFRLSIGAFHGDPSQIPTLWAGRAQTAVAYAEKELETDADPRTWERVEVATSVTPQADFAVVEIRAVAPKGIPASVDPFPGHFADLIDAKVCLPLRASRDSYH